VSRASTICRMCLGSSVSAAYHVQGFSFHECRDCGFVFSPDFDSPPLTNMYQSGARDVEAGAPDCGWADPAFLDPAFDMLGWQAPMTVLDFGAGQSRVPDILRLRGHRVIAVDVVPPKIPHADRLTGELLDLNLPEGYFDLAYSFQVFEHLPEPRDILFELLRLVRDEGLVLIHTDMETPERDVDGFEHWWYVTPPDHCSFYRHKTFDKALSGSLHQIHCLDEKTVVLRKSSAAHNSAAISSLRPDVRRSSFRSTR
jgi:SAM-dependent methyltransferase